MNKMIGIVGGIGSYAGIDLIKKIYDQTIVYRDQDHLPVAMLSIPHKVPDRTEFLIGNIKHNPGIAIAEIISNLADLGAEIIGIPCNTAHVPVIFDKILNNLAQQKKNLEIVHLIQEVGKYIKQAFPNIKNVGILSTTGTFKTKVYPDLLRDFGLKAIQVSDQIQEVYVQPAIYDPLYGIKAVSNPVTRKAVNHLKNAVSYLRGKGAEVIVLGCTEIPLAITAKDVNGLPILDATYILARALVHRSSPEKLK